ncbi:hypothetical protein EDB83DRAFT_2318210 [Lactarius deliciosus]|nr:hypothetical protein EDB83DRAFT_2318210 [Lactarius deliciosus]
MAKKPYDPTRSSYPTRTNAGRSTANTSNTTANVFPPKLTDEERRLLREHEGCFKCRVFYAGHRADKCTASLSGENYQTLTVQDALKAKPGTKNNTRAAPIAAMSNTPSNIDQSLQLTFEPLAAIFPSASIAENSFSDALENSLSSLIFQ